MPRRLPRRLPHRLPVLPLIDAELLISGHKCDMIQIKFDRVTLIAVVTVVFTQLIVGEDTQVIEVLTSIRYNQLVDCLVNAECAVGMEFHTRESG